MNRFANTHEIGMTLQSQDDMSRRFKGGGSPADTTTTQEPPDALQGAYGQYGQMLTGTGGTPSTGGYWSGGEQIMNPDIGERGHPDYISNPDRQWVEGQPGTPGSGGFLNEYNPTWYQGQRQADVPEWLQQGMNDYRGYQNSESASNAAEEYQKSVMAGDYLGLSPSMRAAVMNPAMDASASRFAQMGRYGSPASSQQMGLAGMQAAMPYYDNERSRQGAAAGALPAFDMLRDARSEAQFGRQAKIGEFEMGRQQATLNDQIAEHEFNQNSYYDKMMKYGQLLSPGSQYGITTQSGGGPGQGSTAAGIAGGALSGAATGSTFGPYGAAAGAILGGIGGAM